MTGDKRAAARQRLETLVEAFDYPDPHDEAAMMELNTAKRRISELVAGAIMRRPDLRPGPHAGRIPEVSEGGPSTAAASLLWELCVRYERIAGLIEVYVGEERLFTLPVAVLRGTASDN